ncbi:hypothetical protein C8K30_10477 [Promicromonospora sp. AC04]|uniref:SMI1/KNR4 family protein n=1 Tax=Promicromonospora sp. AC04 TaxID=2135723 RepID=UPI000D42B634|nr:SMI1/KNR4 family protein [Promicromonospora sp. AC04]PUB27630.1 hypothetical protein C8K30_10477 [Promicromonospora sp. AC04]
MSGLSDRAASARLISSVQPIGALGEPRDWERLRPPKGTLFPSDYRAFIDRFGGGYFEEDFGVLEAGRIRASGMEQMVAETSNVYSMWGNGRPEDNVYSVWEGAPESVEMWAWGVSGSADIVCWDISSDDPESWATIVWDQTAWEWTRYELGFSEFLLTSVFEGYPDLGLIPSGDMIRYLSYAEDERRFAMGISAWS